VYAASEKMTVLWKNASLPWLRA